MNEKITKISDSNFDSLVIIPKKPAVVFFSANWSESSQMVFPIIEATAEKYMTKVEFYEMNVGENSIIPIAYGIRRIPAVLTFDGGRLGDSLFGSITPEKLVKNIEKTNSSGDFYKNMMAFSKKFVASLGRRLGVSKF
ncbi:MAG: thioredoxin domain-containing protein [Actinomycetota bacterium]